MPSIKVLTSPSLRLTAAALAIEALFCAPAAFAQTASEPEAPLVAPRADSPRTDAAANKVDGAKAAQEVPTLGVITVKGRSVNGYRAEAGSDGRALLDTASAVSVVTRGQLDDQAARLLSDVIKSDASIGENYAPVGYYQDIAIRGFALDLSSSYQINGMPITGEQNVALENKESVEFLKGVNGIQGGVIAPGGLVNYVTKRAAEVRSVTVATDQRGSRYGSADLGTWFGEGKNIGIRVNAADESMHSYVEHADGTRNFFSLASDVIFNDAARLQLDIEHQHASQHSVSAYQLLGGTTVPSVPDPTKMLGYQSWAKPVTINSLNLNTRFDYKFNQDWSAKLALSRSKAVIDDNVAFAYGCYSVCATNGQYFSASGDYDVYDYRSPDDTRINTELQGELKGRLKVGSVLHEVSAGLTEFRRTVDQTDSVYDYVGTDNIYNSSPLSFAQSSNSPGAFYRRLDSRQHSLLLADRISFNAQWQLQAGGRWVRLREKAFDVDGETTRDTEKNMLLPQVALIYKPLPQASVYGSYSEGLSLGGQAPAWASNAYTILAPTISHQLEAGVKYDLNSRLSLNAALFRLSKAYEYAKPDDSAYGYTYVQQGTQVHTGLELGAVGKLSDRLQINASVAAIHAIAEDTGTAAYDGHQTINVPRLRAAFNADYALPALAGLNLLAGVQYSGRKAANREGSVEVPSATIFNAGVRHAITVGGQKIVTRLTVDNLFDKRYWKDVGESGGDSYLHVGAPRTARLSVQYDF